MLRIQYNPGGNGTGGSSYDHVDTYADLPITVGTPIVGTLIYVDTSTSDYWLFNKKPSGFYRRVTDTGALTDWEEAGDLTDILPPLVSQAEAEAGTVTSLRSWTCERIKQAAQALVTLTTLGGTAPTGTGAVVRANSPSISGTATFSGGAAAIDISSGDGTLSASGGGTLTVSAPTKFTGAIKDSAGSAGSAGQTLKSNGSGIATYGNDLASYVIRLNAGGGGNLAASQTAYAGWQPANGGNQVQGRYRVYIPKTGTIRTVIFYLYGGGGSAHNLTVDVWLNNSTAVGQTTLAANVFPGIAASTGLSQAVTGNGASGDYIELRASLAAGATTISSLAIACDVYIETAI